MGSPIQVPAASITKVVGPAPIKVWVTRTPNDAQAWILSLNGMGFDAQPMPLMASGTAPDQQALRRCWHHLDRYQVVMFVSANAVRYFWDAKPSASGLLPWDGIRAWVTGVGSQNALLKVGLPSKAIDAPPADAVQFDSEALWSVVAPQIHPGLSVLVVRGCDDQGHVAGRDWLVTQLQAAGARVDQVAAYQRQTPAFSLMQLQAMRQSVNDGSVWLFSNSEAIAHLQSALPEHNWQRSLAVATHPRIADKARQAGWGYVAIAQPALQSVASSIKSCHEFSKSSA
jgi:uroporphyrinogen-III synthase